jgi:Ca-activated chloride channel family protein
MTQTENRQEITLKLSSPTTGRNASDGRGWGNSRRQIRRASGFHCPGMQRRFVRLSLAFIALTIWSTAWPQQPKPKPPDQTQKEPEGFKIGVEVNMVTVPVTVRKAGGGFAKGLPQSAFRVLEDGEEQEIVLFSQEAVPARIAIVLDISGSVRTEWGSIKYATLKFMFSLTTFNTETRLKMDWGNNRDRIDRVDRVLSSIYCKDNTNLWDTIWVVCNDVFKGIKEKKAVIIMSDGLDNNSSTSYKDALDAAIHSEAALYIVSKTEAVRQLILYEKSQAQIYQSIPGEIFVEADLALRRLAHETGGRVLYPNSFGQLDNVYAEVDDELRNQYTIGYISSNKIKDGSYRRIQVAVEAPATAVSARPGYFAPNEIPASSFTPASRKK